MTFERIVAESCKVAGELFVSLCEMIKMFGEIKRQPSIPEEKFGPNKKWSGTIEDEAREVLKAGTYKCYAEEAEWMDRVGVNPQD